MTDPYRTPGEQDNRTPEQRIEDAYTVMTAIASLNTFGRTPAELEEMRAAYQRACERFHELRRTYGR